MGQTVYVASLKIFHIIHIFVACYCSHFFVYSIVYKMCFSSKWQKMCLRQNAKNTYFSLTHNFVFMPLPVMYIYVTVYPTLKSAKHLYHLLILSIYSLVYNYLLVPVDLLPRTPSDIYSTFTHYRHWECMYIVYMLFVKCIRVQLNALFPRQILDMWLGRPGPRIDNLKGGNV